jgi:hypothetical protein
MNDWAVLGLSDGGVVMRTLFSRGLLLMSAGAALVGCLATSTGLNSGKPAPEIHGVDADSKSFRLSDYRGKVVLLDFWASY